MLRTGKRLQSQLVSLHTPLTGVVFHLFLPRPTPLNAAGVGRISGASWTDIARNGYEPQLATTAAAALCPNTMAQRLCDCMVKGATNRWLGTRRDTGELPKPLAIDISWGGNSIRLQTKWPPADAMLNGASIRSGPRAEPDGENA